MIKMFFFIDTNFNKKTKIQRMVGINKIITKMIEIDGSFLLFGFVRQRRMMYRDVRILIVICLDYYDEYVIM